MIDLSTSSIEELVWMASGFAMSCMWLTQKLGCPFEAKEITACPYASTCDRNDSQRDKCWGVLFIGLRKQLDKPSGL